MSTSLAPWKRNRGWSAVAAGLLTAVALSAGPVTASASEGTLVQFSNRHSGLCMSLPGDVVVAGARIDQWACGGYPDQYWYWNPSDSHPGWFYIQPQQNDSLCATYVPNSTANLTLQACGANASGGNFDTQLWHYDAGNLEMQTMQHLSMSVPEASTAENSNINTYQYDAYPDQFWVATIE